MHKLILLVKSYRPDFERAMNLLRSIHRHNKEGIPVFVLVNDSDHAYFSENLRRMDVSLIRDGDVLKSAQPDPWRYQQIIKSSVYRLGICENYLCIDSDSEFFRDFGYSDFMYDRNTPYTVMHESKGFLEMAERIGRDSSSIFFKEALRATRQVLGSNGKDWDYGPSPYIWSCEVWRHFNEVYLADKGLTFEEFLSQIDKISAPSECAIYGEYLLKTKLIGLYPIGPLFKVYHFKEQYVAERGSLDASALKKIYFGTIMQSNWCSREDEGLSIKILQRLAGIGRRLFC